MHSPEHKAWEATWFDKSKPLDILYSCVPAWKTVTDISLMTMRVTRVLREGGDPDQFVYQEDHKCGTWEYTGADPMVPYASPAHLVFTMESNRVWYLGAHTMKLWFENLPGTTSWLQRSYPEAEHSLAFSIFLTRLILQKPVVLRPVWGTRETALPSFADIKQEASLAPQKREAENLDSQDLGKDLEGAAGRWHDFLMSGTKKRKRRLDCSDSSEEDAPLTCPGSTP